MGKEIEVGSDVLKAVDDGVERCFLIALASLSSRGVWGFAVNVSHRKTLICFIKRDKNSQKLLNFKAHFGTISKANSSVQLAFAEKSSACFIKKLCSARRKVG